MWSSSVAAGGGGGGGGGVKFSNVMRLCEYYSLFLQCSLSLPQIYIHVGT